MTVIAFPEESPEPLGGESWKYDFALEDDAHSFAAGVREELAEDNDFSYVDSEIWFSEEVQKWILRIDVVRLDVQYPKAA